MDLEKPHGLLRQTWNIGGRSTIGFEILVLEYETTNSVSVMTRTPDNPRGALSPVTVLLLQGN